MENPIDEVVKLNQQIAELQKKSEELKKKNRPVVVAELRERMAAYGITAQELTRPVPKARMLKEDFATPIKAVKGKIKSSPLPAKFRSPDGKNEWSGRGMAPKWMNTLIEQGHSRDEFLISKDAPAQDKTAESAKA